MNEKKWWRISINSWGETDIFTYKTCADGYRAWKAGWEGSTGRMRLMTDDEVAQLSIKERQDAIEGGENLESMPWPGYKPPQKVDDE